MTFKEKVECLVCSEALHLLTPEERVELDQLLATHPEARSIREDVIKAISTPEALETIYAPPGAMPWDRMDYITTLIISDISNDITEEERVLLQKILAENKDARDLYEEKYNLLMSDEAVKGRAELSKNALLWLKAKNPIHKLFDRIGTCIAAWVSIFINTRREKLQTYRRRIRKKI